MLVSDRPYRRARTRAEALKILDEESGDHLWSPAVDALKAMLNEHVQDDRRAAPRVRARVSTPEIDGEATPTGEARDSS